MTQQARRLSFSKVIFSSRRRLTVKPIRWRYVNDPHVILTWCIVVITVFYLLDGSMTLKTALQRYLGSLKWTPLPLGLGFAVISYQQYKRIRKREELATLDHNPACECYDDAIQIQLYKMLPLKIFSRVWGTVHDFPLPTWCRNTLLGSYVKTFKCNMTEAEIEDIKQYRCLGDLFRRKLKLTARPIDMSADVVSPADGTVLSSGRITGGLIEQVKGITYSAKKFLGPNNWTNFDGPSLLANNEEECFHTTCLENPRRNDLYQITIYLSPGDYHRFHSPADWNIFFRRHFPGELLSVNPFIASWIRELFVLNERVSYIGKYKHGFFSMTAVGATNVGSVVVPFDEQLKTNRSKKQKGFDEVFETFFEGSKNISLNKGSDFGEFNLGSTIVLIFEAPKSIQLTVQAGDRIQVGQAVCIDPNLQET